MFLGSDYNQHNGHIFRQREGFHLVIPCLNSQSFVVHTYIRICTYAYLWRAFIAFLCRPCPLTSPLSSVLLTCHPVPSLISTLSPSKEVICEVNLPSSAAEQFCTTVIQRQGCPSSGNRPAFLLPRLHLVLFLRGFAFTFTLIHSPEPHTLCKDST